MNIEIINKDENNFVIKATNVNLDSTQYQNFISRIKGALSKKYKYCQIFIFDDILINGTFKVKIPNGYYDDHGIIESVIREIYYLMRNN